MTTVRTTPPRISALRIAAAWAEGESVADTRWRVGTPFKSTLRVVGPAIVECVECGQNDNRMCKKRGMRELLCGTFVHGSAGAPGERKLTCAYCCSGGKCQR
jgi:hypothetical protein